nr:MAG TPA: hypothetical protein [Caudoviricetes sp.]
MLNILNPNAITIDFTSVDAVQDYFTSRTDVEPS